MKQSTHRLCSSFPAALASPGRSDLLYTWGTRAGFLSKTASKLAVHASDSARAHQAAAKTNVLRQMPQPKKNTWRRCGYGRIAGIALTGSFMQLRAMPKPN